MNVSAVVCLQVTELAEAMGSKRGPPGFLNHWERRPAVLIINKADLLIDHPGEVPDPVLICYVSGALFLPPSICFFHSN